MMYRERSSTSAAMGMRKYHERKKKELGLSEHNSSTKEKG
jgi:hypothetical protein